MKTHNIFILMALICLILWVKPDAVLSQPLCDSTANYFTISAYYDQYFDSLVQLRGVENMQGTGYKDYLRWKWFYSYRHGVDGDLSSIWHGINEYRQNVVDEDNGDGLSWQFVGPLGIPPCRDLDCNSTGKGMMLSLWVDPNADHSLIYAGSHHSGLWKTTDGGVNWFPMTENNPEIVGVNSIAVYPGDPNKIFITSNSSLGDYSHYSVGIFKSLDGGLTWDNISPPVEGYPSTDQSKSVRKIVIDEDYPDFIFFISHNKVYRSNDQGENWDEKFNGDYNWDVKGLFDFKITPWPGDNTAYLAGSQIYRVDYPTDSFGTENISDQIFLAGLTETESMEGYPSRTEICMPPFSSNVVWFCYSGSYKRLDHPDDALTYIRVVKLDENGPELLFEQQDTPGGLEANDNKLEFIVSPVDYDIFYIGGVRMMQSVEGHALEDIRAGDYPDPCWLHDDIRDMQVVFNDKGSITIYTANDAGISAGYFDESLVGCEQNQYSWHWTHLCESLTNGLDVTEFYGIGLYEEEPSLIAGGCQDVSGMLFYNNQWYNFFDGDATELVWEKDNPNMFYFNEMGQGFLGRTNDLGQTHDYFFPNLTHPNIIIPMEIDPKVKVNVDDPTILYTGNKNLYRFSGVNIFSAEPEYDILDTFSNNITDIEAAATTGPLPKFYVSTNKYYNQDPGGPFEGCLFVDKADGVGFIDISSGLDGCKNGFVSDIEFRPQGHFSQVWVAFAGYSKNVQNKKVFKSGNGGATWTDFSQGLPPGMPVYKIKYVEMNEEETFLLAATDVGVFKSGTQTADWVPINDNLPKSIVTDIEVNPKFNVVYASTYGRGLWKSSLYCHYESDPLVIESETDPWVENRILDRDIIIPSGVTLTIRNCIVYLPSEAKIIVERGATLILDGSTLTSACSDLWWGVELWGNSRYPQTEQYQGMIVMENGAVIEKARKAIFCGKNIEHDYPEWDYTGGIVDATESKFLNNRYGVQFWTYHDNNRNYLGSFRRCTFQTNEMLADGSSPEYFMTLVQVNGILIEGCDFEFSNDEETDYRKHGNGIFSLDAGYTITDFENLKLTGFKNLFYGILAMKVFADPNLTIHDSYFTSNITGLYARGLQNLSLYSNDFYIYIDKLPVGTEVYGGVYLDNCSGYLIEENDFTGPPSLSRYGWNGIGITINNSGEAYNVINDNTFNQLYIGTLAQNNNRSEVADRGLKILCNTYNLNEYDITVTGNGCVACGIALYQGIRLNPAGNLFSRMDNQEFHNYINELSPILYFHHHVVNIIDPPVWYPKNTSPIPLIVKENTDLEWQEGYCASRILETGDKTIVKDFYLTSTEVSDSLNATLLGLIDGGNTDALETEITFAQPDEALELQGELLDNSPFLSDTILITSAEKEDVLTPVMVKDIMVANPQSAKSEKVLTALENRENPLPEYMMQEILEGLDTLSQKEILEAEISEVEFQKEIALNRLISIFREDTISARLDSIIYLLQNHNTLSASYQLVMTWLEKNDTVSALNTLAALPSQFNMTSNQELVHEHWIEWVDIVKELNADSLNLIDSDTNMIERMNVLAQFDDQPGCLAKNTLHFLGILETGPYYILPGEQLKSVENKSNTQIESTSYLTPYIKLYPNPAKNYMVVEYNVMDISNEGLLNIYTATGNIQLSKQLHGNQHDFIINTKDWHNGIYFFNFTSGSEYKQSGKVIIAK